MRISILVAAHKPYWMPKDPAYVPLRVGRALAKNLDPHAADAAWQGDDTGDNISAKNRSWCELTALYWAWKNLPPCDAVGLCHYRRYFGHWTLSRDPEVLKTRIFGSADYAGLLGGADIILPKKRHYYIETVRSHYQHAHTPTDLAEAERAVRELAPDYAADLDRILAMRSLHILNMFVMKRELFEQYCAWLFPILQLVESRIDLAGRSTYETRALGFLSERLLNAWACHMQASARIVEAPVVSLEPVSWPTKGAAFLRRKFLGHA